MQLNSTASNQQITQFYLEKELDEELFPDSDSFDEEEKKELKEMLKNINEEKIEDQAFDQSLKRLKNKFLQFKDDQQLAPDLEKIKFYLNSDPTDKSTGWGLVKQTKDIKIYTKKEDSVLNSMRAETIKQNKDIFELFSLLKDPEKRKQWDKHLINFDIIKKIDDKSDLLYFKMQPPMKLISPRDYVLYRYYVHNKKNPEVFEKIGRKKSDKNQLLIYMKSVTQESHPINKGTVRAHMHIMTALIEECEDNPKNIKFTFINMIDVKGNIQKMFKMIMPKTFPKMMAQLDEGYEKIVVQKKK